QRAIADDGDDLERLAPQVAGNGHAERGGDRSAGVAGAEGIIRALITAQIAGNATKLLDRAEAVAAARHELMRIGLVADIPDEHILRSIERDMERERQFHGAEIWSEMPTAQRHGLDDFLAYLLRQL